MRIKLDNRRRAELLTRWEADYHWLIALRILLVRGWIEDREAVIQTVWMRVWANLLKREFTPTRVEAWLWTITGRVAVRCLDVQEGRKRRERQVGERFNWDAVFDPAVESKREEARRDQIEAIHEVINELDIEDIAIIEYKHFENLGVQEIAHELGIKPRAVQLRYAKALKRLRDKLKVPTGLIKP